MQARRTQPAASKANKHRGATQPTATARASRARSDMREESRWCENACGFQTLCSARQVAPPTQTLIRRDRTMSGDVGASARTTREDVFRKAWAACDTFRGLIDAAEYKDY